MCDFCLCDFGLLFSQVDTSHFRDWIHHAFEYRHETERFFQYVFLGLVRHVPFRAIVEILRLLGGPDGPEIYAYSSDEEEDDY